MFNKEIRFSSDDFEPILKQEGIDPESITDYEWSKYTDAFCDGTYWSEVARYAVDVIHQLRSDLATPRVYNQS